MNEYGYDDFFEPSEFDQDVETLKERLRSSVKQEILDELEQLRADHDELELLKMQFEERVRIYREDCRRKELEAQRAIDNAKCMRFDQLMSEVAPHAWAIGWDCQYPPKCNLCDVNRLRHFTSPLGREMTEDCPCRKPIFRYYVKKVPLISIDFENNGIKRTYYLVQDNEEPYLHQTSSVVCDDTPFESITRSMALFFNKDRAEAYAAWLDETENAKEK